jgi:hypothetical protein
MFLRTLKRMKEKRLRNKIVFRLLAHPKSEPQEVITRADCIYRYVTGATFNC